MVGQMMFTLVVEGIPVIRLQNISEIPSRQGDESWLVIDENRRTIASYSPKNSSNRPTRKTLRDDLSKSSVSE